jgi:hypothetical protein
MTATVVGTVAAALEIRVRGRISTWFTGLDKPRRPGWEVTVDGCTDRASLARGSHLRLEGMDNRVAARESLTSRRAKISPEQAGMVQFGQRRVPGLRCSEVASLAGVSVEYYAKFERGSLGGVSAGVLDAPRPRLAARRRRTSSSLLSRPGRGWHDRCDASTAQHLPAADRQAQRAVGARHHHDWAGDHRFARYTLLDSAARRFFPDWDLAADMSVANLRTAAGRDPHDRDLHDLVGELSTRSDDFRRRWSSRRPHPRRRREALPPPSRRAPQPQPPQLRPPSRTRP